jgi:ABC-type transport system involved in multi-copper enzyme maturation permease subunit
MSSNRLLYVETAPSSLKQDEPVAARVVGVVGWCLAVFGAVVALTNIYMSPRWIPEWLGWLAIVLGLVGVFVHAAAESDKLIRQTLGYAGAAAIVVGLILAGAFYKHWAVGLIPLIPGLMLLALYVRREDDEMLRTVVLRGFGAAGAVMALVGIGGMLIASSWIAGPGSVLAVVGLLTLVTFLVLEGPQSEIGRLTAVAMSVFGGLIVVYAFLRSTTPFLIHDWRSPVPAYALPMTVLGAACLILGVAGRYAFAPAKPEETADTSAVRSWSRIAVGVGVILLTVGILRFLAPTVLRSAGWSEHTPGPYLVPRGIVQMFAGFLFVIASISFWSENRLVVMTRREFTAFFASPVAYFVMCGFTAIGVFAFVLFVIRLMVFAEQGRPVEEPIVASYFIALFPVLAVMVAVPLVTMRLFSEEKRTGTLEVMLTAPVGEGLLLASKFIGTLMFFMLLWVPWLLFLLALRLEAGQPFDFRPVLGFVLTLFVSGAGFIAMGMFFSSVTQNQIVAAALTFAGMMALISFYFFAAFDMKGLLSFLGIQTAATFDLIRTIFKTMSFIDMWSEAISGKVMLKDVAFHFSAAVMWLLATYKVLEARRWS